MASMHDRRRFLTLVGACAMLLTTQCNANLPFLKSVGNKSNVTVTPIEPDPKLLAKAAPFVKPEKKWTAEYLYEFLNALPNESLLSLKKELGLVKENTGLDALQGKSKDVRDIQKQALWLSTNILVYPFSDETVLNYHDLVTWVAMSAEVKPDLISSGSTFILERAVQMQWFAKMWDKLTVPKREELLNKIFPNGKIEEKSGESAYNCKKDVYIGKSDNGVTGKDIFAVASLTSAGAIGVLSTTVAFNGFAFYTTMSVTISTVAGVFGLTLPFAAYTGASSLVAFLSGPIGWTIAGIAAIGGVALSGRANVDKTTAFILQLHALKAAALIAAGIPETEVFCE